MKLIFLDTFVINQLMKENGKKLIDYIVKNNYAVILTSLHLVELYNKTPLKNLRIQNAIALFRNVNFVIVDAKKVMIEEENKFPKDLVSIPIEFDSGQTFKHLIESDKESLLNKLFTEGLPEFGIDLFSWVKEYENEKNKWISSVKNIMKNAKLMNIIDLNEYCEYLDLRLCPKISEAKEYLDRDGKLSDLDKNLIVKLYNVITKHNTYILKGIHLTSLIFWWDYIKVGKIIKPSDVGDILFSIFFPYCDIAVVDKSRHDTLEQIKKKCDLSYKTNFLNKKKFVEIID